MADSGPARSAIAVTPHATNALTPGCRALYVGGAGDITCRTRGNATDVVFSSVPAGTILPVEVTHVRATGTTATNIVAMY